MNAPAPSSSGLSCRLPRFVLRAGTAWSAWAIRALAPKEVGSTESFPLPAFSLAQGPQVLRFFVFPRITWILTVTLQFTYYVSRFTLHVSHLRCWLKTAPLLQSEAIEPGAGGVAPKLTPSATRGYSGESAPRAARERSDSSRLRLGHGWPSTVIARIARLRPAKNRDKL
jgi:hypothetical protein